MGQLQDSRLLHIWRTDIAATFTIHGLPIPSLFAPDVPEFGYVCYHCGNVARTPAGWHAHRRLQHGVSKFLLGGCESTCCPCCKTEFHTYTRLQNHLRGTYCGIQVSSVTTPLTEVQLADQKAEKKQQDSATKSAGYDVVKALKPCKRPIGYKRSGLHISPKDVDHVSPPKVRLDPPQPPQATIPTAPIVQHRYVLHLYSGQRRLHDLQVALEKALLGFAAVLVLSIDIVNGAKADLSNPDNLAFWTNLILAKPIILVFGGPPCNTWSAARYNAQATLACEDGKSRPRPVRSAQQPWGLDTLNKSERDNVDAGNLLLRSQSLLMWHCAHMRIPAMREHPADPWWIGPDIATSTWRLQEEVQLFSQPGCGTVTFRQRILGADAKKPTTLGYIHVEEIQTLMDDQPGVDMCHTQNGANTCGHEHVHLEGTDSQGNWITAPFKQYPPALNRVIARSARLAWDRFGLLTCEYDDPFAHKASSFFVPLDPYCEQQTLGHFGGDLAKLKTTKISKFL